MINNKELSKIIETRKNDEIIIKKSIPEWTLLSEKSFSKTWLGKEEDEAWINLK